PSAARQDAFQFVTSEFVSLPDQGEQLAAGALLPRLTIGHHALRRAEDRHAEAVANAWNLRDRDVLAQSGGGDATELTNHRLAALRVLEYDAQHLPPFFGIESPVVLNEVVLLQDLGDLHFQFRDRHVHAAVLRPTGVAYARKHIGDRICHAH